MMAKWIDSAVIWALAAVSAFVLWMVLGGGRIPLAVAAAFGTICGLRFLIQRLPDKRWVFRKERQRRAQALVRKWACSREPGEVLSAVDRLLPALTTGETGERRLIQRLSEPFSEDELLEIWRAQEDTGGLTLITTVRATAQARELARQLTAPAIRLLDGEELIGRLSRLTLPPETKTKTGRRQSFGTFAARLAKNIRPLRAALYGALFALLYGLTRMWPYLVAASIQTLLAGAGLVLRHLKGRKA